MKKPTQHLIAEVPHRQARTELTIGIDLGDVWSHYCTLNQDGERKVVALLNANLKQELAAAKKISKLAVAIIKKSAVEPETKKKPKTGKEKYSALKSKEDEREASPAL